MLKTKLKLALLLDADDPKHCGLMRALYRSLELRVLRCRPKHAAAKLFAAAPAKQVPAVTYHKLQLEPPPKPKISLIVETEMPLTPD